MIKLNIHLLEDTGDLQLYYSNDKGVRMGDTFYCEYRDRDKLEEYLRAMRLDEEIQIAERTTKQQRLDL